jgi:hypothetical protein
MDPTTVHHDTLRHDTTGQVNAFVLLCTLATLLNAIIWCCITPVDEDLLRTTLAFFMQSAREVPWSCYGALPILISGNWRPGQSANFKYSQPLTLSFTTHKANRLSSTRGILATMILMTTPDGAMLRRRVSAGRIAFSRQPSWT